MKLVRILVVLAMMFAVSAVAYAETQSVKISGDIAERAFARSNYNLNHDQAADTTVLAAGSGADSSHWGTFLQSTVEVQVDADLTDNVGAVIRLLNQKAWGDNNYASSNNSELGITGAPFTDQVANRQVAPGTNSFDVELDLAYIELKEFLYSPLTLKIGRQDLWFGRGFIVGANLQDNQGTLLAPEYTAVTSFDAIRATLDYDPWTIDAVYAKVRENFMQSDDDVNLWGANVGYVFENYNAEAEAYWWYKDQRFTGSSDGTLGTLASVINGADSNEIHTVGGRGSFDPIEDWTVALESAYQFGQYVGINNAIDRRNRSAWSIDAMIECRYFQNQFAWKPVLGVEYIYYSGEEDMGDIVNATNGTYTGWDPMYRGKFDTAIREWQNVFYRTNMTSSPAFTNQHQILVRGSVEPTESLTCSATYGHFWLDQKWATQAVGAIPENTKRNVGDEVDLKVDWDYTEDVTFSVLCGWFFPGDHFSSGQGNDVATDLVGSVKLSF